MGKQGPCYHCGITTTPLWRNGPPDKPVLCNACGSRWRTKGTLLNYMPMHSGGFGVGTENARWPMKNTSSRPGSGGVYVAARPPDHKTSRKRKELPTSDGNSESGLSKTSTYLSSSIDEEDASTMASEISTFDGPLSNLASAVPGRGLAPWDTPVPSRRRTNMFRSRASSEKMSRKLQVSADEQEVSSVTCPSSDILLETNRSPLVAVEIGLGSVFIRPPAHLLSQQQQQQQQQQLQLQQQQHQQQESEASSLLIDSNTSRAAAYEHTEVFSNSDGLLSSGNRLAVARGKDKLRPALKRPEAGYNPNKTLLESFSYNKRDVLQSVQSPLVFLELKDIVNLDTFTGLLTEQEQLQLMKYLSSVDASQCPDSLRSLFSSSQFEGALSNFQRLLSEGMFDSSEVGFNPRLLQHYQQLLSVTDLTASGWTESLSQLQSRNKCRGPEPCVRDKVKPEVELLSSAERTVEPYKAGSSSAVNDSSVKAKKAVNLMEEGHDSGGEQEDLLVEVPSFHKADSLLLLDHNKQQQGGSWPAANVYEKDRASNINIHNNTSNVCGGAEVGDLIVTNTWQTADWDGGLIWNNIARGRRDLGNGTMLRP